MSKSLTFMLFLPIIIPLLAPNFACGAVLAPESQLGSSTIENTAQKPLLQEEVQELMEKAQNKLQEGASKAYQSAQEAAQSEIQKQAEKQVQATKGVLTTFVKKTIDTIKENISKAILKIKNIFVELKNKIFSNN